MPIPEINFRYQTVTEKGLTFRWRWVGVGSADRPPYVVVTKDLFFPQAFDTITVHRQRGSAMLINGHCEDYPCCGHTPSDPCAPDGRSEEWYWQQAERAYGDDYHNDFMDGEFW